jgi:hypothetical protein
MTSQNDPYLEVRKGIQRILLMIARDEGQIDLQVQRRVSMSSALEDVERQIRVIGETHRELCHAIQVADDRARDEQTSRPDEGTGAGSDDEARAPRIRGDARIDAMRTAEAKARARLEALERRAAGFMAELDGSKESIDQIRGRLHGRRRWLLALVARIPDDQRRAVLSNAALQEQLLLVLIESDDTTWDARKAAEALGGDVPPATIAARLRALSASKRLAVVRLFPKVYGRMGGSTQPVSGGARPGVPVPLSDQEQRLRQEALRLMREGGDRTWTTGRLATTLGVAVPLVQRVLRRLALEHEISRFGPSLWGPRRSSPPPVVRGRVAERIISLMSKGDESWNYERLEAALGDVARGTLQNVLPRLAHEALILRLGGGWYARLGSSQTTCESLRDAIVEVVSEAGANVALTAEEIERAIRSKFPEVEPERVVGALRLKDGRLRRTQSGGEAARFTLR